MLLTHCLVVGALLFCIGAYGVLTRRNAIALLMGIELMLNAANLNFLAFWRYLNHLTPLSLQSLEPQVFVLIGVTVAAADAAVGLAIVLNIYRDFGTIEVEEINLLKG